ncbi:hypothetical protein [Streptomyces sp. NPDC048411]
MSGRIGTSLDLERTIREVTSAAVPRFADFAVRICVPQSWPVRG